MGIRTPCYTKIKQEIILVTWVSEHHAILQQKNKIILVTWVSEHHAILQ
jgi:hypothetical protein